MTVASDLQPPPPIDATGLFPVERRALLDLLAGLTDKQWATPTACPGWTVKDVALHLLGVDLGNLSVQRDGFVDSRPRVQIDLSEKTSATRSIRNGF